MAPLPINQEWAASLVGLQMKAPNHWWDKCKEEMLHEGRIAAINFGDSLRRYFKLELDSAPGTFYAMRYDVPSSCMTMKMTSPSTATTSLQKLLRCPWQESQSPSEIKMNKNPQQILKVSCTRQLCNL